MTVAATTRKAGPYTGNGVTTAFPFAFKVFADTDLVVTETDLDDVEATLVLATDYTVSRNADQNANPGGTVNLLVAPVTGFRITLTSAVPYAQAVDLTNQGGFYPAVINTALDRLTVFAQQLSEQLSRAVTVPVSSTVSPTDYLAQLDTYQTNAAASASAASASASAASASASAASASASAASASASAAAASAASMTNGTMAANVASLIVAGVVGIGTASPVGAAGLTIEGTTNANLHLKGTSADVDEGLWRFRTFNSAGNAYLEMAGLNDAASAGAVAWRAVKNNGNIIDRHEWYTNGSERLRLDLSGRLQGGFNATGANFAFQHSTTNSASYVVVIPNGTTAQAGFVANNNSDPANGAWLRMFSAASATYLDSGKSGTGTTNPFLIQIDSTEKFRIATDGTTTFGGTSTAPAFRVTPVASQVNWLDSYGAATTGSPFLRSTGSDTNVGFRLGTRGAGSFSLITDAESTQVEQVRITHTASANRYITLTGSNGGNPTIGTSAAALRLQGANDIVQCYAAGTNTASLMWGNVTTGGLCVISALNSGATQYVNVLNNNHTFYSSNGASTLLQISASGATDNRYVTITGSNGGNPAIGASAGTVALTSGAISTSSSNGLGYGTGAGGTVTQITSKATGVTLSKPTGEVTMHNAALAAGTIVSFTLTNTTIAVGDHVLVQHVSGGTVGAYSCTATAAAGSATIYVRNATAGSLSEAIVLKVSVLKSATT